MNTSFVFALAFTIGVVGGLRSFMPLMVLAWAVHFGWLRASGPLSSLLAQANQASWFLYLVTGAAVAEIALDKHPKMMSRLSLAPLIFRIVIGGCSGVVLAEAGGLSTSLGAVLGSAGAVAGAYAGNKTRAFCARTLTIPDFVVALVEDAVAIGLGFLVVSRFAG